VERRRSGATVADDRTGDQRRIAEVLLYDVRRTVTLAGPTGVFVAPDVEGWLKARAAAKEVVHLVNVPSNPPGWSAGKWGECYPDLLGPGGKLSEAKPKPYWRRGWLSQDDRLMQGLSEMLGRIFAWTLSPTSTTFKVQTWCTEDPGPGLGLPVLSLPGQHGRTS